MKKLISVLLILALALTLAPLALADHAIQVSTQAVTLNNAPVRCQAYNVDGYNYFRLRDLAMLFQDTDSRFSVDYDEKTREIRIVTGESYYPNGSELPENPKDCSDRATVSSQTLVIDGERVTDVAAWNFAGNNYFKLADLSERLHFRVSYDEATRTVRLESRTQLLPPPTVKNAVDYPELLEALRGSGYYGGMRGTGVAVDEEAVEAPAATPAPMETNTTASADGAKGGGDDDYSGTNVQVEGVDEGDIVKTDGKYIYVLNGEYQLTILRADGANTAVVSRTDVGVDFYEESDGPYYRYAAEYKNPTELYISGGRLAIVSSYNSYLDYQDEDGWHWENESRTCVDVYDVSDPAAPKLLNDLGQDGYRVASRLVGDKLYLVTRYWVYNYDEDEPVTYAPALYRGGEAKILPVDCIWICGESNEYVVAAIYDLSDGSLGESQSLLGSGDEIYMTADSLYVLGSTWEQSEGASYTESVYTVTAHRDGRNTEIYRFDLTDGLSFAAAGKVPGYVDSQFSADEHDGYFRIVTTRSESIYRIYEDKTYGFTNYEWEDSERSSGLYVLDKDLNLVGSVADLAPGEQVYSARFDGDVAYFTTFRNVDPLFTVDLSDPANPTVLSALKISGFSEYLHNWTPGRLFGFGREADEDTGWAEELKLVMFNTEDKTDVYAEHTLTLDESWSEALYNHKAFFIDAGKNIIGFDADGAFYVFSYETESGFTQLCRLELDEDWDWNMRGLYIGSTAYIVGRNQLAVVDMSDWTLVTTLSYAG